MQSNHKSVSDNYQQEAARFSYKVFFVILAILLGIILTVNQGALTFVLDDPFIHLALAENIIHGHYGVNMLEASSASSSILWPFLLAPFTLLPHSEYAALLLNILFAVLSLKAAAAVFAIPSAENRSFTRVGFKALLVLFMIFANLLGLVLIGMEHCLQLWLCVVIILGLLRVAEGEPASRVLFLAIIAAPLVRYETLAVSMPALLFLLLNGYWRKAIISGAISLGLLVAFSLYLKSLGLDYLPTSILLKADSQGSLLLDIFQHLKDHYSTPKAVVMTAFMLWFLKMAFKQDLSLPRKQLAGCMALAIVLFLMFGRYGWYFRYEIFIWASTWLVFAYLAKDYLIGLWAGFSKKTRFIWLFIFGTVVGLEHIFAALVSPIAANNIYLQQYQMARFSQDYYQKPVAVNDLGLVSFNNPRYVLDLWGLASADALQARKSEADIQWMQTLAERYDVGLAMMYYSDTGDANGWFEQVPASWIKLGELQMSAMGISVSKREVVFFATNKKAAAELRPLLQEFSYSLPRLSSFVFSD